MYEHVLDTIYFIKKLLHYSLGSEYGFFVLLKDIKNLILIASIATVFFNLIRELKIVKEYMNDETLVSIVRLLIEATNEVKCKILCGVILSAGFVVLSIIIFKIMIFTISIAQNILIV